MTTIILNTDQLFTRNDDKQLLIEYHEFIAYILKYTNHWVVESSSIGISEDSVLFRRKDDFIQMLQQTFPTFEIIFHSNSYSSDQNSDLESESKYSIEIIWKNNSVKKT